MSLRFSTTTAWFLLACLFGAGGLAARPFVDLCSLAPAQTVTGSILTYDVIDGDTFDLNGNRIRPWGINAAEKDERPRGYNASQQALVELVRDRQVSCRMMYETSGRQRRCVSQCNVEGVGDLGETMLRNGWVCIFPKFIRQDSAMRPRYERAQEEARLSNRGLWSVWLKSGLPRYCAARRGQ
jgi:endonuclease YncB( thermonuclease family)